MKEQMGKAQEDSVEQRGIGGQEGMMENLQAERNLEVME